MKESEIIEEANEEFKKEAFNLAKDIVREANELPQGPAPEKENLDIIKHLLKRLAVHQVILDRRTKGTNTLLVILNVLMVIFMLTELLL